MECVSCGIEFEGRKGSKTCSAKCRNKVSRKHSIVTDNVTLSANSVTLSKTTKGPETFEFTVKYSRRPNDPGYDEDVAKQRATSRKALYWYNVPIGAVPALQAGWPAMPSTMHGRQYFLWYKNGFKVVGNKPVILNPYPVRNNVQYVQAGEGSRRWGA